VRIAFSGTHGSGKSTLLERVAELLPDHATVDEPYHLLEEEGYETAEEPSIEDFEAQLERSLSALAEGGANVLFDRCPADPMAYALAHDDAGAFDASAWRERVGEAMETLDLVVFVPIESPDRIAVPAHEDRAQRRAVHEQLEALLIGEGRAFDVEVLVVEGDVRSRVRQVMARLERY
jgi:thymidylate kinase